MVRAAARLMPGCFRPHQRRPIDEHRQGARSGIRHPHQKALTIRGHLKRSRKNERIPRWKGKQFAWRGWLDGIRSKLQAHGHHLAVERLIEELAPTGTPLRRPATVCGNPMWAARFRERLDVDFVASALIRPVRDPARVWLRREAAL